ncbi:glycosyltransferase family 4 protein [Arthrobacter sp. efr-133-R2A-63]|uniref:glycosyltransferase family 4 protein n=1 Tax=Arthrobacter TaxID=1663 RepID=UPI003307A5AF
MASFQPDFIYWSHSYLAAVGSRKLETSAYQIVEFANIERDRFLSISKRGTLKHRASAFVEFLKACRWERRIARGMDLCVAISSTDEKVLNSFGGKSVLVENALPGSPWQLSPDDAVVMSIANWDYGPNREGMTYFLDTDWHTVLEALPEAKLVLAGNGSVEIAERFSHLNNVAGVGFADDLTELFNNSTLFLAPARSGAGRQLKVAEALGHARAVVGPPFLNRERRPGLPDDAINGSDDVAAEIIRKIQNLNDRHIVEKKIAQYALQHDWQFETASLRGWMKGKQA